MKKLISAVVISGNAGTLIEGCLDSIKWVDEIIIVNTDLANETLALTKKYQAKVVNTSGGNFSDWRNLGAKEAMGEWLLYVDTDERVPVELKKEILIVLKKGLLSAYALPRKNNLLGRDMHWGGWWPDYVLRLIRKDKLVRWQGSLHEQPVIKGEVGKLDHYLYHITHRSLSEMVEKTNLWSEVEAQLLLASNHPRVVWWRFFSIALREFWQRGIIKLGFLDGPVGVIEIFYQMFSRVVTYAKLWEMQTKALKI